jgi:hypothetical protein
MLKEIITVKSIDFAKNNKLAVVFDELALLKDGWYEGDGSALDSQHLETISKIFIENYPEVLPLPLIVPPQDGNLLIEWNLEGYPSIELNVQTKTAHFQSYGIIDDESLIEKEFTLTDSNNIADFFDFLIKHFY